MRSKVWMPAALLSATMLVHPAVIGSVRADAQNLQTILDELKGQIKDLGAESRKIAEDALRNAKEAGTGNAEVKQKVDETILKLGKVAELQAKAAAAAEEADARIKHLEQQIADFHKHKGGLQQIKSLGEFVAGSDALKAYVAGGAAGKTRIQINQAITSLNTSGGDLIAPDRDTEIVRIQMRRMTVRDLLTQGRTTSNLVQYAKQTTRTNNAAVVSETVQKPESTYVWDLVDAAVRTIAHFVIVARQTLDDAAQLQTELDSELRYGLAYAEEVELLSGSGAGQHLNGINTQATAYSAPTGVSVTGKNKIDVLRMAMLQASLAEFPADGMILHPTDWASIELTKDGENRYLWANPRALGTPTLWGLPVVATQAQTVDKFTVGAFKVAATIYDRMEAEVLLSSEDGDNFKKNLYTIRAEKRLALAVKRPLAITYGDFSDAGA